MNNLGVIAICVTLMLIALVGYLYFYIQDKKDLRRKTEK